MATLTSSPMSVSAHRFRLVNSKTACDFEDADGSSSMRQRRRIETNWKTRLFKGAGPRWRCPGTLDEYHGLTMSTPESALLLTHFLQRINKDISRIDSLIQAVHHGQCPPFSPCHRDVLLAAVLHCRVPVAPPILPRHGFG
jgi:hypothetical protein